MSRVGLDWYKREPVAYLGDVQGITSKEHAVYSVVLDLLYVHGGSIRNDPKFISGYISDMGSAAVRKVLASLDANSRITLEITESEITQKRAKTQAKLKRNQIETAQESGRKGGIKSAELRRQHKENNNLDEGSASTKTQPEKRREEKRKEEGKPSSKKGTRLSPNWELPPDFREWAEHEGLSSQQISDQGDRFQDYWIAKSGAQAVKLDWLATWRNWIRNSKDFQSTGGREVSDDQLRWRRMRERSEAQS